MEHEWACTPSGLSDDQDKFKDPVTPSRIPYPSIRNLSPIKHERIFDPSRKVLLNVSRMALHASDGLWAAQAALGRATIDSDIDAQLRELVILRVAHLQGSDYELFHHRVIARNLGVQDADISAVESDDCAGLSAPRHALMAFVAEVVRAVSPSDATLATAREHYSDRVLFDITIIVGSYMLTARLAAVGGVATEDQPVAGW